MRYPWVNSLLLVFVCGALVTGYLGLTNGDPGRGWTLWLHAGGGWAVVALLGWKAVVIQRSIRRRQPGPDRPVFILLALLLLTVLATGLAWAWAGRLSLGGTSLMTWHVLAAAGVLVLLCWHVVVMRPTFRVAPARDRRAFLRLMAAGGAGLALWQGSLGVMRIFDLPGARRRFTGSYETGSFTGRFPRVSWLFDDPAPVDREGWRLVIDGAVQRPLAMRYDEVAALAAGQAVETLDCTGGWYTTQEWVGVPLARLLDLAGVKSGASSVTVQAVSGYDRKFSLGEARTALLATHVAGRPLSHGHGFPARLVIPDHRGFDWVKWVTRITVNQSGDWKQSPLPLQ